MPLLVVDGPEKAGKTTLLNEIIGQWGYDSRVRGWSGPANDRYDTRNLVALAEDRADAEGGDLVGWSRSWASEHVYGTLLGRSSSMEVSDAYLGEWLYGRAVQSCGLRVMLLPADSAEANIRKDSTDHPINSRIESAAFRAYADQMGWLTLTNDYTLGGLKVNVDTVLRHLGSCGWGRSQLPSYAGPWVTPATFVATRGKEALRGDRGEWLPFSSEKAQAIARILGPKTLECGWAYAHEVSPNKLKQARTLVATDDVAFKWCVNHVGHRDVRLWPTFKRLSQIGLGPLREAAYREFTSIVAAHEKAGENAA